MRTFCLILLLIQPLQVIAMTAREVRRTLKGSPTSLARQIRKAKTEKLSRITEKNLAHIQKNELRSLIHSNYLVVDPRLPARFRYARPWTIEFLDNLGRGYFPLQVNSAVRTVEYQKELRKRNKNAAKNSSHVYGSTVDIAKLGMTPRQIRWMRHHLAELEHQGLIEATEEHHQAVFHIMVFNPDLVRRSK